MHSKILTYSSQKSTNFVKANFKWLAFIFLGLFVFSGCQQKTEYQKEVEKALNSGVRNDSLILGYTFGMSQEEFFEYSWDINKKGIVTNGAGAEILEYVDSLRSPARRTFYPKFNQNKITQLPVVYRFEGWAPWNTHLFSDTLLVDVIADLEQTYGSFTLLADVQQDSVPDVFYNLSGNREIRVQIMDQSQVRVLFTDLSVINKGE